MQRTHESAGEARKWAPRPAGLHGLQQRYGARRKGGGAADAQALVKHCINHARRQLAPSPQDLLDGHIPVDQHPFEAAAQYLNACNRQQGQQSAWGMGSEWLLACPADACIR